MKVWLVRHWLLVRHCLFVSHFLLVRRSLLARHRLLVRCCLLVGVLMIVSTCALTVVGCGGSDAARDLDGTSWTLSGWSVSSLDPNDFTITASFADGTVSGTSAVNSYSGTYSTGPDDEFSTGDIASTTMAGPEDAMRAEQLYVELLGAAASYQVVGGTLTLFDEFGDEALVFATTGE